MKHPWPVVLAVLIAGLTEFAATPALAALVNPHPDPNSAVPLLGTTAAMRPELEGAVLANVIRPFSINLGPQGTTTGWVQDVVVRSALTGTLDFYYRVHNDSSSNGSIDFATREGFAGWVTDVDYRVDGPGHYAPTEAYRAADGNKVWIDLRRFDTSMFRDRIDTLSPGEETFFTFIKTNATSFNEEGLGTVVGYAAQIIGTFPSGTFSSFQPVATVPLPPAIALLASGLLILLVGQTRPRIFGPA